MKFLVLFLMILGFMKGLRAAMMPSKRWLSTSVGSTQEEELNKVLEFYRHASAVGVGNRGLGLQDMNSGGYILIAVVGYINQMTGGLRYQPQGTALSLWISNNLPTTL